MRRRIQDTLVTTKVVHGTPDPQGAAKLLETAGLGEVAMLQVLSGRDSARIDRAEMRKIAKDHEEFTTFNLARRPFLPCVSLVASLPRSPSPFTCIRRSVCSHLAAAACSRPLTGHS